MGCIAAQSHTPNHLERPRRRKLIGKEERERERETLKKKMREYVVPEYRSEPLSVFQLL